MKRKTLIVKSESKYLKPLRTQLTRYLKQLGVSEQDRSVFLIAAVEACTNSIRHAYQEESGHSIRVTVQDFKRKIVLRIRDYGRKINLSKVKTPKLPPTKPHGLGIYFLKTMMDELTYNTRHRRGNELVLAKHKQ